MKRVDDVEAFCGALWRHETMVVAALAERVDPNGTDRWGNTPLLSAARYGDLGLVSLLVRRGAGIDQGRVHLTPITLAARRQASDIVGFLRDQGARASIITAIHLGDGQAVARILEREPTLARVLDKDGTPALHHAAEALRPTMVELLLAHGATVADVDRNGESALHRVADLRPAEAASAAAMASLLLDRGADADARNRDDVTPLHQAVRARNLAVVTVLLDRGADVNARDRLRGSTPLRRAVSGTGASGTAGTAELMAPLTRLLLEHGADPDALDRRGVPVHASARAPEVIAVLDAYRAKRPQAVGRVSPRPKAKSKPKPKPKPPVTVTTSPRKRAKR